jgi:drug/metabolite transporter (DMT)-like permease
MIKKLPSPHEYNLSMGNPAKFRPPAPGAVLLALGLVYVGWGTTNLAIKEGVKTLPPALFAGSRIFLAGICLLGFLKLRGEKLRTSRHDLFWISMAGVCLFVGGNGLITLAAKTLPSGLGTVLVSTSPLFLALLEALWPWGERLTLRGWLGMIAGTLGLLVVLEPRLVHFSGFMNQEGLYYALLSALTWAFGSFIVRHHPHKGSHLKAAGFQMLIGGGVLTIIGLAVGEMAELTPECFTTRSVFSFFYLLIVGSLIGFICYNWLLKNVSAVLAGTYAYVNPLIAILVGWWIGNEELSVWVFGGMFIIVAGIALVRSGGAHHGRLVEKPAVLDESESAESEEIWECEGASG